MPLTVTVKPTTSGAEIEAKLTRYINRAFKVKVRKAVAAGNTVFLRTLRDRTPKRTGFMARSHGSKVISYPSGAVVGIIGPRRGFKLAKQLKGGVSTVKVLGLKSFAGAKKFKRVVYEPSRIVHIVEKRKGFIRGAFESSKAQVQSTVEAKLRQELATA